MEIFILIVFALIYSTTVYKWFKVYKKAKHHLLYKPRSWLESRVKDMVLLAIIFWPVLNLFILVGLHYEFYQDAAKVKR